MTGMCGIVGYVGRKRALPVLVDGLRRLEYRGYDSAGVAVLRDNRVTLVKSVGRLEQLEGRLATRDGEMAGSVGIGHTRWATHGRPSDINAHPHGAGANGQFFVVHNGIIENYLELREWLAARGHAFASETDTEVIPHLIAEHYRGDLTAAVREAAARLRGSFALAVLSPAAPDRIIGVRHETPLIVGLGQDENYLASDLTALLPYTRRAYVLEDGEVAIVTSQAVAVTDLAGRPIPKQELRLDWDPEAAERGGFPHFMLKEIHEQPRAFRDTLAGRIDPGLRRPVLPELGLDEAAARALGRVHLIGCGSAWHASLVGRYLIERMARLSAYTEIASEFRYREPLVAPGDLCIAVSQSGETLDTLAAMREARARGARVVGVTNVAASTLAREANATLLTRAGPEIAVCSTKAYTTQILVLTLIALELAHLRGTVPPERITELLHGLGELPRLCREALDREGGMGRFAAVCADWRDVFFIGRGLDYAAALEGQLKLKEVSYIHAEAYPAGELKHGTLALITDGVPVVALCTQDELREKAVSNVQEVKARGGYVLAVAQDGAAAEQVSRHADHVLRLPSADPWLMPVLAAVPLQLLAYHAAVARGCDVDKPRNLAKSVTVE